MLQSTIADLVAQLNEKSFKLEVKAADNRIIQEQLNRKADIPTQPMLELRNHKLAEESSYAKGLASAAAVELKELSEEVAKLMNHNERLMAELAAAKNPPTQRRTSILRNGRRESLNKRHDQVGPSSYLKRELAMSKERELSYEAAFLEKDWGEAELQRKVEVSKQREAYLENELANYPSRSIICFIFLCVYCAY
ncbi:hypothetical protein PVK06_031596 [Gossypium arboreum]|uniref:Uncharacterized protein n=1 Tax=Gossypium arboreum TaxID=29729 RepID=A0ABR0NSG3_GOSAR|nr:hypothetical protein PVK06_031596 [Gossypium arboreum]